VHLVPESAPCFRIHGELREARPEPLTREECASMLLDIAPDNAQEAIRNDLQADFPYVLEGVGRHRVNVFAERRGLASVIRLVPPAAPGPDTLGLPPRVRDITSMQNGLVLVTGRTGSGKSTTQAALVDLLNEARPVHIITLEDPIEYLHERKRGLVNQREIGRHSVSCPAALRAALREDPDVMVGGEMRDLVTMRLAVEAAETGHLVIATLHTPTAVGAVQRLIEAFPVAEQQQVRLMLSDSLRMVIAQSLVKRVDGAGRVGVFELLLCTQPVSALIRENKLNQVLGVMQTGKENGMRTFDMALLDLVASHAITGEEGYSRAQSKDAFKPYLKGA